MGKSACAQIFEELHIPVHDSDAAVRELWQDPKILQKVFAAFKTNDKIEVATLVFNSETARKKLESIFHPAVRKSQEKFLKQNAHRDLVVLDIPLLFETGADKRVDHIVVASAPANIQKKRVLSRPNMTEEKFKKILSYQMPDEEKRSKAGTIIDTGKTLTHTKAQIKSLVNALRRDKLNT